MDPRECPDHKDHLEAAKSRTGPRVHLVFPAEPANPAHPEMMASQEPQAHRVPLDRWVGPECLACRVWKVCPDRRAIVETLAYLDPRAPRAPRVCLDIPDPRVSLDYLASPVKAFLDFLERTAARVLMARRAARENKVFLEFEDHLETR